MTTPFTILLDVDGVLADFLGTLFDASSAHAKMKFPRPDDIRTFELRDHLTAEQHRVAMHVLDNTAFAKVVRPMIGAQEMVKQLSRQHDVFVVTSPWTENPTWESDRRGWLKKHFDIPEERIVSTTAKHLVDGDVLVDDRVKHTLRWKVTRKKEPVLFTHAHNGSEGGFTRINAWNKESVDVILRTASANRARQ